MDIDGQRRSEHFEDRGQGRTGGGGGLLVQLLFVAFRFFGFKGVVVAGVVLGGAYLFAPTSVRRALVGGAGEGGAVGSSVCQASADNGRACDFSRAVLASTEDVWARHFAAGALPTYGRNVPRTYAPPTLVVFSGAVTTDGCGTASSGVGPFYCPADAHLYIDPRFYATMASRLDAPGDFAQAYVIAHEVGHHVQHLIGSLNHGLPGESKSQQSVRAELQADCLAGVWGHGARGSLKISDDDLAEATGAAHAIGDDALGHRDEARFTHGTSAQRVRWFRRGFQSGDPRQCDTFAVGAYDAL